MRADRGLWTVEDWWEGPDAILLVLAPQGRRSLFGLGDPVDVRRLLAEHAGHVGRVDFATLPRRGAGPAGVRGAPLHEGPQLTADEDVPPSVLAGLGLVAATAWDRFETRAAPGDRGTAADSTTVELLDLAVDSPALRDCLAAANPGSQADPSHPDEAAWFGVRDGARLVGVVGAARRCGDPAGSDLSWHVHGLGVRPGHRRRGLGGALTAAATGAALDLGADWVSLGMYADNAPARRVYERLGFQVAGRFTSYRRARG